MLASGLVNFVMSHALKCLPENALFEVSLPLLNVIRWSPGLESSFPNYDPGHSLFDQPNAMATTDDNIVNDNTRQDYFFCRDSYDRNGSKPAIPKYVGTPSPTKGAATNFHIGSKRFFVFRWVRCLPGIYIRYIEDVSSFERLRHNSSSEMRKIGKLAKAIFEFKFRSSQKLLNEDALCCWDAPLNYFGGDFYWARRVADKVAVIVGDVSGHDEYAGIQKAMLGMLLELHLATDPSLGKGMQGLLDGVIRDYQGVLRSLPETPHGLNLAACLIGPGPTASYIDIGIPMILAQPGDTPQVYGAMQGSKIITADSVPEIEETSLSLAGGKFLIFVTDGVTGWRPDADGAEIGQDGVVKTVKEQQLASPEGSAADMVAALKKTATNTASGASPRRAVAVRKDDDKMVVVIDLEKL